MRPPNLHIHVTYVESLIQHLFNKIYDPTIYIYIYTSWIDRSPRINDRNVRTLEEREKDSRASFRDIQLEARLPRDYCNCTYTSGAIDIQLGARHGNFPPPRPSGRRSSIVPLQPAPPDLASILLIETSTTRQPIARRVQWVTSKAAILFESSVRLNECGDEKKIAGQLREK